MPPAPAKRKVEPGSRLGSRAKKGAKGKQAGGIKGALTRKFGPLPAWAWLAAFALAAIWWRSRHPAAASATVAGSPSTGAGGGAGAGSPGSGDSGSGGGGDSGGSTPTTGASVTAIGTNVPAIGAAPFATPFAYGGIHGATLAPAGGARLQWGGQVFSTQAQFNAWLKARGLNTQSYFQTYPGAGKIYATLPGGATVAAPVTKVSGGPLTGARPTGSSLAGSALAAKQGSAAAAPSHRPVAVKPKALPHRVAKSRVKKK